MSGTPNSLSGPSSSRSHRVLLRRTIGMIQAITKPQVGLNVITELIVGYALLGRPIAMNLGGTSPCLKVRRIPRCSFQVLLPHPHPGLVAPTFASDFKLGHYMKIPPRTMFFCQVVATVIAGTVQLGVQSWRSTNTPDMCSTDQPDGFICPSTQVFGTASIIWGVVGPISQFSSSRLYYAVLTPSAPPGSAIHYVSWAIVGFIFQYWICRKHLVVDKVHLRAVGRPGLQLGYHPRDGTIGLDTMQTWWGNTVFLNTADGMGLPYNVLAEGATFGLSFFVLYLICLSFSPPVGFFPICAGT
ncbi:OPT oligopeptide transporter protein-domain-containing protein [Melanogaster broomeanus]|nr:OPT oligopeptide transporter protein-domain-containing protein [Melanogaster broomeanus]